MATYFARKAGNINAVDVWATTPSGTAASVVFASGDVLLANSFTITVNVSTNLGSTGEIRNDTTGGATAGGVFNLTNNVTLTANIYGGTGSGTCVDLPSGSGSATIIGNVVGGSGANAVGARNSNSTGTLTITGNITGGSASGSGAQGVNNTQAGTVNITGTVTGGSTNLGATNSGAGTMNINGNVIGGNTANAHGAYNTTTGTLNITGNVSGGSAGDGVFLAGSGSITITGTVTGGSSGTAVGAYNNSTGSITIVGTAVASSSTFGAQNFSTGTLTITRAKGNNFGNGSVGSTSQVGVWASQNGTTKVYEIEYGDLGQSPTSGPIQIVDSSTNVCLTYRTGGLTKKTLVDASATAGAFPSNSDVRSGVSFNNGNNIGTMNVPSSNSVAYGVSVDNTTGTAVLTPANVWNYLISNISTSGSIGERLKNCSTIASVGQQLSDSLSG